MGRPREVRRALARLAVANPRQQFRFDVRGLRSRAECLETTLRRTLCPLSGSCGPVPAGRYRPPDDGGGASQGYGSGDLASATPTRERAPGPQPLRLTTGALAAALRLMLLASVFVALIAASGAVKVACPKDLPTRAAASNTIGPGALAGAITKL